MNGGLSLLVWLPLAGAILVMLGSRSSASTARAIALGTTVLTFLASIAVFLNFRGDTFHFQMVERYNWIPSIGVQYELGIDGISIWLLVLTTFMGIVGVAMSRYVERNVHAYMALLLGLESFVLGAFSSLDLILFFTFFELTLFPMYFLIALWGGERRSYAAAKFFLYTFAGSIFLLIGMIALAYRVPTGPTFDIQQIQSYVAQGWVWNGATGAEQLIFWAFAVAFLIKAPSFPFHTWMPDAYGESPSVVPVVSGVMAKLGTFGLIRFCLPLFPDVLPHAVPVLMGLAVAGIVYGAIVAAIQPDARRLIAYSSLSHVGFILLGIFSLTHSGLMGASFQQLTHGVVAGGLMVMLSFLYERRKTLQLSDFGGLKAQMPTFAAIFLILMLASVGLPGTNGFIGEFLALLGSFETASTNAFGVTWIYPALAGLGVVLAAVYLLYMFQQIFYGPVSNPANRRLRDLKTWEAGVGVALVAVCIWGGLYPNSFFKPMEASLQAVRMMALNPVGSRPMWADSSQEIDLSAGSANPGALISLKNRAVIAKANVHYGQHLAAAPAQGTPNQ